MVRAAHIGTCRTGSHIWGQYDKLLPVIQSHFHDSQNLPQKIYQSITDEGAIKHEDITKQRFLHLCIADKKLILSKSFVDILSYIFADTPFANEDALKEKCQQTKLLLPEIILSQLLTAGNLISNIHGAEYITNVFDKNKKVSKKPNIFMANCSLSKIYAKEETKRKFESVLLNLNPTLKDQDSSRKISISRSKSSLKVP